MSATIDSGRTPIFCQDNSPETSINTNLLGPKHRTQPNPSSKTSIGVFDLGQTRKTCKGLHTRDDKLDVKKFVDAACGGEVSKSQTGVLFLLGSQPRGWYSRSQDIVILFSSEAEYVAACEAAKDASWTKQLLAELPPRIVSQDSSHFNR